MTKPLIRVALFCVVLLSVRVPGASAQVVETVGSRALGMGGAFVAVASDATATWWNPAGLAVGPFLDMSLGRAVTEQRDALPAWRAGTSWFALGTPPLGVSYYRFRITDIQPPDSTDGDAGVREEGGAAVPLRSLSASQLGVTVLSTLATGVHAGTTLKYVRGARRGGAEDAVLDASDLLDLGEALDRGSAEGRFDLDAGVLAVAGVVRLGAVVRNIREPAFGDVRLPRQIRVGVAIDPEPVTRLPLTVALDADVAAYETATGDRRVVAAGVEHWLFERRLGLRAGGRVNTVGARERAVTAGVSVAARAGLFLEGHVARGGTADEQGWGVAARISF